MRPVDANVIPCCNANEIPISPKGKDLLNRIKTCSDSVFKCIRENRYILLSAGGFALGVIAFSTKTLVLLPLAVGSIFFGIFFHQSAKKQAAIRLALRVKQRQLEDKQRRERQIEQFQKKANELAASIRRMEQENRQRNQEIQQLQVQIQQWVAEIQHLQGI